MEINLHFESINQLIASNHRLEKHMSALTDATTKLTTNVAALTVAVKAIPSAAEVATAVTSINAAADQIAIDTTTLAGDVAAPPVA